MNLTYLAEETESLSETNNVVYQCGVMTSARNISPPTLLMFLEMLVMSCHGLTHLELSVKIGWKNLRKLGIPKNV